MRKNKGRTNRRRIFLVAAAAMTLLIVCALAVILNGQEEYVPQVQAAQMNVERSQVYLDGKGYKLDQQQEKIHKQQEKQREEKLKQKQETQKDQKTAPKRIRPGSVKPANPGSGNKKKPDSGKKKPDKRTEPTDPTKEEPTKPSKTEDPTDPTDPTKSEEERAMEPTIKISVAGGEVVNGTRLDFSVTVTDYKGRNIPVFSESDGSFMVSCNGEPLSSEGADGSKTWFRTALKDGKNTIVVTAVDREGHDKTKTVNFTGNTSAAAEVTGEVYVSVSAEILNLGTFYEGTIEITRGDTAKDVLETALSQAGIDPSFRGGYLSGISRSGIAQGAYITDEVRTTMEELRKTEKDPADQDPDKLKEHDFYDSSGWIYSVNGTFPEKGLGSYKLEDGDELNLIFSLADGVY